MSEKTIGHVTKPSANIFAELGFDPEEAAELKRQTDAEIAQVLQLKQQLMQEISGWMAEQHLKQSDAAKLLGVSRPRVSDVVNLKTSKFTLDSLVQMLGRAGRQVHLSVR